MSLNKGLVGHWKLDGNGKDSTPYSNHGTIDGATSTTDRQGKEAGALLFDGTDDGVALPITIASGASFTIAGWLNIPATPAGDAHGDFWRIGTAVGQVFYAYTTHGTGAGKLRLYWSSETFVGSDIKGAGWKHVTLTRSGSTFTLYIDAVQNAQGTDATAGTAATVNLSTYTRMNGSMDDIRIYNRALSLPEIKSLFDSYQPQIKLLDKGLVGHWTLDGHAKDRTPYNNHGTITGAVATTDRHGKVSGALDFDGTNDYVDLGANYNFAGDSSFSVSGWVYFNDNTNDQAIITHDYNNLDKRAWRIGIESKNFSVWIFPSGTTTNFRKITGGQLNNDRWYYVAVVKSSTTGYLYIDGALSNSGTLTDVYDTAGTVNTRIGIMGSDALRIWFLNGSMDDVRIYNRALSATEVKALYDSYNPNIKL